MNTRRTGARAPAGRVRRGLTDQPHILVIEIGWAKDDMPRKSGRSMRRMRIRAVLMALMCMPLSLSHVETQGRTTFPARLERYMADTVKLTAVERQRLMS